MMNLLKTIIFLSSFFYLTPLSAEERVYDIELIIFQNIKTPISKSNYWKPEILVPTLQNAITLSNSEINQPVTNVSQKLPVNKDFVELPAETYQLSQHKQALTRSHHYKILKHLRWRQPGLAKKEAISIRMNTGEVFPLYLTQETELSLGENKQAATSYRQALDSVNPLHLNDYQKINAYSLDGTIKIHLGRYLHIDTDLILTLPITSAAPPPQQQLIRASTEDVFERTLGMQSYRFKTHRRMRSKELHHLDHPKFGLLINIVEFKDQVSSQN